MSRRKAEPRPSPIHGLGIFAKDVIRRGEFIGQYTGPRTDRHTAHTLWVDFGEEERGYEGTGRLRYLNHSARPNAEFDDRNLYALRRIEKDEEVTIFYGQDFAESL